MDFHVRLYEFGEIPAAEGGGGKGGMGGDRKILLSVPSRCVGWSVLEPFVAEFAVN